MTAGERRGGSTVFAWQAGADANSAHDDEHFLSDYRSIWLRFLSALAALSTNTYHLGLVAWWQVVFIKAEVREGAVHVSAMWSNCQQTRREFASPLESREAFQGLCDMDSACTFRASQGKPESERRDAVPNKLQIMRGSHGCAAQISTSSASESAGMNL